MEDMDMKRFFYLAAFFGLSGCTATPTLGADTVGALVQGILLALACWAGFGVAG